MVPPRQLGMLLAMLAAHCLGTASIRQLAGSELERLQGYSAADDSLLSLLSIAQPQKSSTAALPLNSQETSAPGDRPGNLGLVAPAPWYGPSATPPPSPPYYVSPSPAAYGSSGQPSPPPPSQPTTSPDPSPVPSPEPSHSPSESNPSPSLSPQPSPTPSPLPSTDSSPSLSPEPSPAPSPLPSTDSSPSLSPQPSPTPSPLPQAEDFSAPHCAAPAATCLSVNATSGTVLDAFVLTAAGWQSDSTAYPGLLYEFGVLDSAGGASVRKVRQLYSDSKTATLMGLPAGSITLYVCVRTAKTSSVGIGPRACASIDVSVSSKVSAEQLASQLSAIENDITSASSVTSTSGVLALTQRLAALAAASGGGSAFAAMTALASSLLNRLMVTSGGDTANMSTSAVLMVFDGVSALWSLAGADSRVSALSGVGALSDRLATQPLAADDAQPVAEFFDAVVADAMSVVDGSTGNNAAYGSGAAAAARAQTAKGVLSSVTHGSDSLVSGLLNAIGCDGSAVELATSRLAAAGKCMTAALAASGGLGSTAGRRRQLLASSSTTSTVNVALNPAVAPLCASDTVCAATGLRLSIGVLADTFLLVSALGGSAARLATGLSDYRSGGMVEIISPIVRFSATGLPASAAALTSLATFDIAINATAVAARGATTRRAIIRLQDIGAAAVDASTGVFVSPSATRTSAASELNMISGSSNSLGDFLVVQYESTAVLTSGPSSPSPGTGTSGSTGGGSSGAAGPALQPLTLLTGALATLAVLLFNGVFMI